MRLKRIIANARNRELKNLSPKDKTDEVIVNYINIALVELYSIFQLRTDELVLNLKTGKTVYKLDGTDPNVYKEGVLYTNNDFMTVVNAYDENGEISINNNNDSLSVFTVAYNKIQVPYATTGEHIALVYRTAPTEVVFVDDGSGNAEDAEVELPIHMMEALLSHIGYSAYSSIDITQEVETDKHMQRFDRACQRLESYGLVPQDALDLNIDRKGFMV